MKTNASHFRPVVGAVVVVLLGLTVIAGGAEAKGGKGDGGGGGGGSNNYNSVIHDLARLNEALQGDVVGFGPRGGGGSDSYEGHPPPWLNLHTPSQRDDLLPREAPLLQRRHRKLHRPIPAISGAASCRRRGPVLRGGRPARGSKRGVVAPALRFWLSLRLPSIRASGSSAAGRCPELRRDERSGASVTTQGSARDAWRSVSRGPDPAADPRPRGTRRVRRHARPRSHVGTTLPCSRLAAYQDGVT